MTAAQHSKSYTSPSDAPRLLPEISSSWRVFFSNLGDVLLFRGAPRVELTSAPDFTFWHDTQVDRRISPRALWASALYHVAVVSIIWSASAIPWPNQPHTILHDPREHTTLTYYSVSDYLPELKTSLHSPAPDKKPDPVYARQKVISLPSEPDNLHQTIVTPPKMKLNRDVQLPNLVAAAPSPMQPIQASRGRNLVLPQPAIAAPAPDASSLRSGFRAPAIAADVVAPAPEPTVANPKLTLPALAREAVPPAPNMVVVSGRTGDGALPIAREVAPPPPSAQVHAARALPSLAAAAPPTVPRSQAASPAGPVADSARSAPGIIALSTNPVDAHGAIEIPEGNRRGTFDTGPEGRPGATGSPGGTSADSHATGGAKNHSTDELGISIAPGPTSSPLPSGPVAARALADPDRRSQLMAAMRTPSIPRPAPPVKTEPRSPLEEKVFSGKRSFTLSVNMPNFNSITGSWIIHFAELGTGEGRSEIAAPSVLNKVDPAYPPELMHDRVQGTVVLYAIIRADGSVTDVRVLSSVHQDLDQSAVSALSRWHFAPGLKNGKPVDLEAVVQIPFRSRLVMMGR